LHTCTLKHLYARGQICIHMHANVNAFTHACKQYHIFEYICLPLFIAVLLPKNTKINSLIILFISRWLYSMGYQRLSQSMAMPNQTPHACPPPVGHQYTPGNKLFITIHRYSETTCNKIILIKLQ